uniref:Transmembrane protein n=1 Tax=Medicago truncatula TaxID=3880 RepID=A2Q152_MEDTR|nr:hypothetical protein MtrDRAFT_AC147482g40v2 [Medicago truncatula]
MKMIQKTYILPKPWVVYAYDGLSKIIIDSWKTNFKRLYCGSKIFALILLGCIFYTLFEK